MSDLFARVTIARHDCPECGAPAGEPCHDEHWPDHEPGIIPISHHERTLAAFKAGPPEAAFEIARRRLAFDEQQE